MHVLRDSLQRTQLYTGSLRDLNIYEVYCVPHHIDELININVLKPYFLIENNVIQDSVAIN